MTWYSTGTVKTTANSAVVIGTGTAWTNSGLRAGDMLLIGYSTISPRGFEIKSIDSATQITLVLPFPVAVTGAGYTGIPMLGGDRTAVTMTLANQVTKALADTEAMSAVYQTFYTSPGTVSLILPGGLVITGSSFQKLTSDMADKASAGSNSDISEIKGLKTALSLAQGGTGSPNPFGSTANTFAQGNDSRLNTVGQKSGGTITSTIDVTGPIRALGTGGFYTNGALGSSLPGSYIGWSDTGISGGASFVCNQGLGTGGFRFRVVNASNTSVITDFTMQSNGVGQSSGGWTSTSDEDVKNNIKEIDPEEALAALTSWRTCSWDYADVPQDFDDAGNVISVVKGAKGLGYIAQDVQKDCPDAVSISDNPQLYLDKDGALFSKEKMLSLNTIGVASAYAGASIKALKKRNEDQAKIIDKLIGRLSAVESKLKMEGEQA